MRRLDLGLFVALVLCAILVVHTQHRARRLFVDLQREHSIADQLAADLRRLQADQATLASANRVERVAVGMRMRQPDPRRTVAVSSLPTLAGAPAGEGHESVEAGTGGSLVASAAAALKPAHDLPAGGAAR